MVDEVYQLFFDLDAGEHHIEFPIVRAIARDGVSVAGIGMPTADDDLSPLLDIILETVPASTGDPTAPVQALVTNLDASDYLGRMAIGRVIQGTLVAGSQIALCHGRSDEPPTKKRLTALMGFEGLDRNDVTERTAGDLFIVAGIPRSQHW